MKLKEVYSLFPSKNDCFDYLEELRWANKPICPYCNSKHYTVLKKNNRYHCNTCNTSYSVTVNTIFHKTKIDLQKWFYAIHIIMENDNKISSRELANEISTTKDTAWRITKEIKNTILKRDSLVLKILEDGKQG